MFNGPQITKQVREYLLESKFEEVESIIYQSLNDFPAGERNRIRQLRKLYDSVKYRLSLDTKDNEERVQLKTYVKEPIALERVPGNLFRLDTGFYEFGHKQRKSSQFDKVFKDTDPELKEKMATSRFNVAIEGGDRDGFGVLENVSICGTDNMMYAYAFGDDYYLNEESGRIAKALSLNTRMVSDKTIEHAFLLPIPHHAHNYYHVMAEMVYGLRFVNNIAQDIPIFYPQDDFNILPDLVERLGIDPSRLKSFDEVKDIRVNKAILPSQPPYFWNDCVFEFYGSIIKSSEEANLKIYLSRSKSGRGPKNETELEEFLSNHGFITVYAEKLSFSQQVNIFSMASTVISPHGAGLTNIAFMKKGSMLVELFPVHMLTRDFFMRSQNNNMSYSALIYEEDLSINDVSNLLKRNGVI